MYERHGKRYSRVYRTWQQMKDRCLNPRNRNFIAYGGRGITVYPTWIESFTAFYRDIGEPPDGYSLDRIDNNGSYCPENCRWATRTQQMRNTRTNHCISFRGETKTLTEWAQETGIDRFAIADRIRRGWAIEKALTEPVNHTPQRQITFNGRTQNLSEWAREIGISVGLLHERLQTWSIEDALTLSVGERWPQITFNGKTQNISEWSRETGIERATIRRRLKRGFPIESVLSKRFHAPKE